MKIKLIIAVLSSVLATEVLATNGAFSIGAGQSAKGAGGAGVAYPQDALAAGANPAGMVHVGSRIDVGLELFKPDRGFVSAGTKFEGNETASFVIPEFGYNKMLGNDLSLGVSVLGAGGMNTDYKSHQLLGGGAAGINLEQLQVMPTVSAKIGDKYAFGVSAIFAYQRFKANGLQGFTSMSSDAKNLTDNGTTASHGIGMRIGWMGQVSDRLALGLTWQPKINMSELSGYQGLLAGGTIDIPANYAVGLAFKASPKLDILLDIMRIEYSKVAAFGNPTMGNGGLLGASNGPGFGWKNQTVYKLGMVYTHSPDLTIRVGYNYGENPVPNGHPQDAVFNSLAPAVVEKHATVGLSYMLNKKMSLTATYMRALGNTLKGTGTGAPDLEMSQDAFGIALGFKL